MTAPVDAVDPFAAATTPLARAAGRLGWSEGQLYTTVIVAIAVALVSLAGLPSVRWGSSVLTDRAAAAPGTGPPSAGTSPPAPPAGATRPATPPAFVPGATIGPRPPRRAGGNQPTPPTTGAPSAQPAPTTAPQPAPGSPLHVVGGGYASALPAVGLVPAAGSRTGLQVAAQGGKPTKVAYVRLAGSGPALVLALDASPGANILEPLAGVLLCPVTIDDWTVGEGTTSLADAPPYDCRSGVAGARSGDGSSWAFALSGRSDATAQHGFALVPDPVAKTPAFQVTFANPAADAP